MSKTYDKVNPCPHCSGNLTLLWEKDNKGSETCIYKCLMCTREFTPEQYVIYKKGVDAKC